MITRDPSLDALLGLDGYTYVLGEGGDHWIKFDVKLVEPKAERPHGLRYALTLHGPGGERLVGFDNAHPVAGQAGPAAKTKARAYDHKHRLRTVRPYDYQDAASLLADFYKEVDAVLAERGVKP